jgi:hypothetical protein
MNTLIEIGTNYGSAIESILLTIFVSMIITTAVVAKKGIK